MRSSFLVLITASVLAGIMPTRAQTTDRWVRCNEFLSPARTEDGKLAGPEECWMRETGVQFQGKAYRRLDLGINGTVPGYAVKTGTRAKYFTDQPDYVFRQLGQVNWIKGVARYFGPGGVGISLVLPESSSNWNGKLYLHVSGAGTCATVNQMPRSKSADPLGDLSAFNDMMLAKGYAVAATAPATTNTARLDTIPGGTPACTRVELSDGTLLHDLNLTDHGFFHVDLVNLAKNVVKRRLGKMPTRTYWYGHSSGARVNRLIAYNPTLNTQADGKPLIDGYIGDDPAMGLWLPLKLDGGKDTLFTGSGDKDKFIKLIDIGHQFYPSVRYDPVPDYVTNTIGNKRKSAQIFRDKGLNSRYRLYEVRQAAHNSGDSKNNSRADAKVVNLQPLMDSLIDQLDAWVEQGKEPPPTKSDWHELGDLDKDGLVENEALSFPEVACPLGVFFPFPPSAGYSGEGSTGFADFNPQELEPLDGQGNFVDMNRNGYRDQRESIQQAWIRLKLLQPGQSFGREEYAKCVQSAAAKLAKEGFIKEPAVQAYVKQAQQVELKK